MRRPTTTAFARRWQVTLIVTMFCVAVTAAAVAGWWYARESTPHQGPIVLISVDGLRPATLQAYGASDGARPGIDALAAEAVVFERAYAHSPLTLPSHASLLAGQLPYEHGVRDEAGFTLGDDTRSMAELLRSRGFDTGAAVSSFLLRRESGVAQGFSFFDAELPEVEGAAAPAVERAGTLTAEAAERWLRARRGNRFFLLVQVPEDAAEPTVTRLVAGLKARNLYEQATIILTADRAAGDRAALDEETLHVPLLVKQPVAEGAGRRIAMPVQHIDLLPTILDLVRAPVPSGLRGRSLRAVLDGDGEGLGDPLVYAEVLAPRFRFGGAGTFALGSADDWRIRTHRVEPDSESATGETSTLDAADGVDLSGELDRLLADHPLPVPGEIAPSDEDALAMLGYLGGGMLAGPGPSPLDSDEEAWVDRAHREAAALAGQKQYAAAVARLREIARAHPRLPVVQYQLAMLLDRIGRRDEAERTFAATSALEPDNPYVPIAVARLRLHAGRPEAARDPAALAVALAERSDSRARAVAHQAAARVALALEDPEAARMHAEAAEREDPRVPMRGFVRGRLLMAAGEHDEARAALEEAVAWLGESGGTLEDLHLTLGEALAQLAEYENAEAQFRAELRTFPRSIRAYSSLALLYHASNRTTALEATLDALVAAAPTPDGYDAAARLWTIAGEAEKAAAVRTESRARSRR
jgi:tetratricopeptide (TPR) repeat protein